MKFSFFGFYLSFELVFLVGFVCFFMGSSQILWIFPLIAEIESTNEQWEAEFGLSSI